MITNYFHPSLSAAMILLGCFIVFDPHGAKTKILVENFGVWTPLHLSLSCIITEFNIFLTLFVKQPFGPIKCCIIDSSSNFKLLDLYLLYYLGIGT